MHRVQEEDEGRGRVRGGGKPALWVGQVHGEVKEMKPLYGVKGHPQSRYQLQTPTTLSAISLPSISSADLQRRQALPRGGLPQVVLSHRLQLKLQLDKALQERHRPRNKSRKFAYRSSIGQGTRAENLHSRSVSQIWSIS